MSRIFPWIGLGLFFVALLGLYMFHMSLATQRGFTLRDLENRVHDLRTKQEFLEAKVAERERLTRVESRIQSLGFVAPSEIHFLRQPTSVALR